MLLVVGSFLGIFIATNIFGLVLDIAKISTAGFFVVGTTIGALECLVMPPYLAFPLGFAWGSVVLGSCGMCMIGLPIVPIFVGLPILVGGLIGSSLIQPSKETYFLV